jgi:hypothetical protein
LAEFDLADIDGHGAVGADFDPVHGDHFPSSCDSRPAACSELAAMNSNNLGGTLLRPFPKSMQGQVDAPLRR